jgi:uncharacterized protein
MNMKSIDQFTGHNYLNLETFRRNGDAMHTTVWFVQDGDLLYIRTQAESGKVKRLRAHPSVGVAVCDVNGRLLGPWLTATGRELGGNAEIEARVDQLLDVKYGEIKREVARKAAEAGRKYTILEIRLLEETI